MGTLAERAAGPVYSIGGKRMGCTQMGAKLWTTPGQPVETDQESRTRPNRLT